MRENGPTAGGGVAGDDDSIAQTEDDFQFTVPQQPKGTKKKHTFPAPSISVEPVTSDQSSIIFDVGSSSRPLSPCSPASIVSPGASFLFHPEHAQRRQTDDGRDTQHSPVFKPAVGAQREGPKPQKSNSIGGDFLMNYPMEEVEDGRGGGNQARSMVKAMVRKSGGSLKEGKAASQNYSAAAGNGPGFSPRQSPSPPSRSPGTRFATANDLTTGGVGSPSTVPSSTFRRNRYRSVSLSQQGGGIDGRPPGVGSPGSGRRETGTPDAGGSATSVASAMVYRSPGGLPLAASTSDRYDRRSVSPTGLRSSSMGHHYIAGGGNQQTHMSSSLMGSRRGGMGNVKSAGEANFMSQSANRALFTNSSLADGERGCDADSPNREGGRVGSRGRGGSPGVSLGVEEEAGEALMGSGSSRGSRNSSSSMHGGSNLHSCGSGSSSARMHPASLSHMVGSALEAELSVVAESAWETSSFEASLRESEGGTSPTFNGLQAAAGMWGKGGQEGGREWSRNGRESGWSPGQE